MKTAVMMLRQETHYRSDAFKAGLQKLGYEVRLGEVAGVKIGPESLLVLWNRKAGREDKMATAWERCGARVLIAENGYIGKDKDGHQYYAMAIGGHNGSGKWHIGDEDRFAKLGIELQPWKHRDAGHILVCGQRGIGSPTMASPMGWHFGIEKLMRQARSIYPVKLRNHPGENAPRTPLEEDLREAVGCMIWSSSSGVKALQLGIPVVYSAPHWVCAPAAFQFKSHPPIWKFGERERAFQRMAWAQWTLEEITNGDAFDALLNRELNS